MGRRVEGFRARTWTRSLLLICAAAGAFTSSTLAGQAVSTPLPPLHRVELIDNARVTVERLTILPGQRTDPPGKTHSGPQDLVVMQLTPGDMEIVIGDKKETSHNDAGKVWWMDARAPHSIANVGATPFDFIAVHLKEAAPAGTHTENRAPAPGATPPNYMHRVVRFENDRVIVAFETMTPGQRTDAPGRVHADPRDGVLIMLTPGNIEFNTGEKIEIGHQDVGKTWWMPKPPFLHSVANFGFTPSDPGGPFDFMLVSLK